MICYPVFESSQRKSTELENFTPKRRKELNKSLLVNKLTTQQNNLVATSYWESVKSNGVISIPLKRKIRNRVTNDCCFLFPDLTGIIER